MPFCYEQTSPLGVHLYAFGLSLSVLNVFFLSPRESKRFLKSKTAAEKVKPFSAAVVFF